jgi:hypothetical protein
VLYFGIRKHCVSFYENDEDEETSGVEMVECVDCEGVDSNGLRYRYPTFPGSTRRILSANRNSEFSEIIWKRTLMHGCGCRMILRRSNCDLWRIRMWRWKARVRAASPTTTRWTTGTTDDCGGGTDSTTKPDREEVF